jgi:vacuolar-type H+-ATPase subunit H
MRRSSLEASTSERLGAIVAAAEEAAAKVIDDAEAEGRRYISDAQAEADRIVPERLASLAALTDSLVSQAETIRQQAGQLLESLAQAGADLEPEPAPLSRGSHLTAVAPVEEPAGEEAGADPAGERQTHAGARLLATQMAVSGSSREEIASRLRNGFEIDDTEAILDAILGPEDD